MHLFASCIKSELSHFVSWVKVCLQCLYCSSIYTSCQHKFLICYPFCLSTLLTTCLNCNFIYACCQLFYLSLLSVLFFNLRTTWSKYKFIYTCCQVLLIQIDKIIEMSCPDRRSLLDLYYNKKCSFLQ